MCLTFNIFSSVEIIDIEIILYKKLLLHNVCSTESCIYLSVF